MDWLDPLSTLLGVVLALAAVVTLFWRPIHRAGRVLRAVEGEPGRPGLMDQMAAQNTTIATIQHQVLPNGGQSMRDAITRTERSAARAETEAAKASAIAAASSDRVQTLAERLDRHIENGKG